MKELNIFDFDDTIYKGDSSIDFYLFCLKENVTLLRYLPIQLYGMLMYKLKLKSKEFMKEKYFSFLKGIKNTDYKVEKFWNKNENKIRNILIKDKNNIVVISASPEFLLKEICKKNGIDTVIATLVDKKSGKFLSKNCYGEEKVNRLNNEYKDYYINEFYSDSKSDKYLAKISKKSFLVKGDKIEKW